MAKFQITSEMVQEMQELASQGMNCRQICDKLKIAYQYVLPCVRESIREFKEKRRNKIREARSTGQSLDEIAKELNLNYHTVALACKGIKSKRGKIRKIQTSEREKLIMIDLKNGMTYVDAAVKYGFTKQYIHIVARKHNFNRRKYIQTQANAIAAELATGEHSEAVANKFGMSLGDMYKAASKGGYRRQSRYKMTERTLKAIALFFDGTSHVEVARITGKPIQNVRNLYSRGKKAGIPFPELKRSNAKEMAKNMIQQSK